MARARAVADWWADLGFDGRRTRLAAWRRLIIERTDELAALVSQETGKPLDDAVHRGRPRDRPPALGRGSTPRPRWGASASRPARSWSTTGRRSSTARSA